jgi:hypothetical protein
VNRRPDAFFRDEQIKRLESRILHWREARDRGNPLTAAEQQEVETLVADELRGSALRAASIAAESDQ